MATATQHQAQPGLGSLFGTPNWTRPIETRENNDGLSTTLSQTATVDTVGLIPFKQTDIVTGYELQFKITNTFAAGGGTATTSPYFPFNFLGAVNLNYQNQFNGIQWASGIDGAIFNAIRPRRRVNRTNLLYTNPYSFPYTTWANPVTASNYTSASTTINLRYSLNTSIWMDQFFVLDDQGNSLARVPNTWVSPQYMSGSARIVQPTIQYNAAIGSVLDKSPYQVTGGAPTFAGTSVVNIKRMGYYQPIRSDGADAPPVYNWQYTQRTTTRSLSGLSSADILVPLNGQILSVYVRMFDPAASSGKGAEIATTNVTECDVLYGSGLYRYQDRPVDAIARFYDQHGYSLPLGVLAWDFALCDNDEVSNRYALNTLNTSGVTVHLDFSGAQSSSAYAVVGVEALTYVETQP